jgi:hypothetical protein
MKFILWIVFHRKKYDYIFFTAGIEFAPKLLKPLWYLCFLLICRSRKARVIDVAHSLSFWDCSRVKGLKRLLIKQILSKVFAFVCLSNLVLDKWRELGYSTRPSLLIPFLTVKKDEIKLRSFNSQIITVCVQGTVCHKRRDYRDLLSVVENMEHDQKSRLSFIFQGPPVEKQDLVFLNHFKTTARCEFRESYLDSTKMKDLIARCDILFAPLSPHYGYGKIRESGIGFDCVRYQIGAIVPAGICSKEFDSVLLPYENANQLSNILLTLNKDAINSLNRNAFRLSTDFTDDAVAEKVSKFLSQNITNR